MTFPDPVMVLWVAGLAGVAFYLGSYALLQSGLLSGVGYVYTLLNLIASSLVFVSLFAEWSLASALIQVSWITISLAGLARMWMRHRPLRFSDEEKEVLKQCFATMPKRDARLVLDLGVWVEAPRGYVLTEQGRPVEHVYFIYEGSVEVRMDGLKIAEVGSGSVIGEMSCMRHGVACATAVLNGPARLFRIRSDVLMRLARREPELKTHLEYAFAHATRQKLIDTNASLCDALNRIQNLDVAV